MELKSFKSALNVLCSLGLRTCVLSGGEPLLYGKEKIRDIIETYSNNHDIRFSMITTLAIDNIELVRYIASSLERVHTSVDVCTEEQYKYVRGNSNWSVVKSNIQEVSRIRNILGKDKIRLSCTVSNMNYQTVYDVYEFAKHNNCTIKFYNVHTWNELELNNEQLNELKNEYVRIADDEVKNNLTISNAKDLFFEMEHGTIKDYALFVDKCYLPLHHCSIDSNGDIYPCCVLLDDNGDYAGQSEECSYGNIINKSESEIYNMFVKRFNCTHKNYKGCNNCQQRYGGLLEELEKIHSVKQKPLIWV